jgi:prepilin-type N-terminal cleavage/methylation domain-containing protein
MRARRGLRSKADQGTSVRSRRYMANRRGDDGFTLIELLIVIIILPIVVGGITAALVAIFQNESTTFNRLANSADAQIASANFARDVQSASDVTTGTPTSPGDCGWFPSTTQPTGATELMSLEWGHDATQSIPNATLTSGSYTLTISPSSPTLFTEADVGSYVLDSTYIPLGTTIVSLVNSTDVTMSAAATFTTSASNTLDISTLASVVTYWDVPVGSPNTTWELLRRFCTQGTVFALSSSEAVAHNLPAVQGTATVVCATATMATTLCNASSWVPTSIVSSVSLSVDEPLSGYQFNLSASPRNTNLVAPNLLLTGSGQSLSLPNTGDDLTVNGEIDFASSSGSVAGPGGTQLSASAGITENQCTLTNSACVSVMSSFHGASTCNGSSPCQVVPTSSAVSVPVVSSPIPPTSPGSCTTTSSTTCQPGAFSSAPLIVAGSVTFASGNYFFPGPVTVSSGSTVSFGLGQYTFAQGLTVDSGASIVGNGVFFYFSSSSLNIATAGTNVQLTPLVTGPYAGLLAYQPVTDTSTMVLGGNTGTCLYGGAIEAPAPSATIDLGSTGDIFEVGALVAGSVVMGSSVTVTVGA